MIPVLAAAWRWLRARFWLSLGFDVVMLMIVFAGLHAWQTRNLPIGEPAPAATLPTLSGKAFRPIIQPGTRGVVYFFAPWCGVCRHSISNLDALVANGTVGWASAVALDFSEAANVRDFVRDTGLHAPVLLGAPATGRDWGVRAFPTYFVIDSSGNIASRSVGYSTRIGLEARTRLAP